MDLIHSTQDDSCRASGVYAIINRTNGKRYIGSTNCFRTRWKQHATALKHGRHANANLQRVFSKFGIESLGFSIVELVSVDKLLEAEQRHFRANPVRYNMERNAKRPLFLTGISQCPTCGESFIKTNVNQTYCEQSCRPPANATLYKKVCMKCNVIFSTPKPIQAYCSHKCAPHASGPRKQPLIKKCLQCGREFRAKKAIRVYCSNKCRAQSKKKPPLYCKLCGKEFYTGNHNRQKFCSKECQHKGQDYPGNKSSLKHGMTKHPLYSIWHAMKRRCKNTHRPGIKKIYYDKGIVVCVEWESDFVAFHNWAITHDWKPGLEIDRRDGDKGYSPSNCRWVTNHQQAMNTHRKLPTSGYRGVHQLKDRNGKLLLSWSVYFTVPGSLLYLGCYRTPEEAARVWDAKAVEIRGDFAILNFPMEHSI